MKKIFFNQTSFNFKEINAVINSIKKKNTGNYGSLTIRAEKILKNFFKRDFILTNSCTSALEMAAILLKINQNDEIIVPSYAFVSTANAFANRRGKIVFADIKLDDLNIDVNKIEKLISSKTKAIVVVHYGGVACEMNKLKAISRKYDIPIIEDAAQSFMSRYKNKFLGTIGDFGTFSFHETKNISSGQGGALIINKKKYLKRAKFLRDKGTNRSEFIRGKLKKYTWVDLGSSYYIGEVGSAILIEQLKKKNVILKDRIRIWKRYHKNLSKYNGKYFNFPKVFPEGSNGHMFYIIMKNIKLKNYLVKNSQNYFDIITHYEPLHSSIAGKKFAKFKNIHLKNTDFVSKRILRLPFYFNLKNEEIDYISKKITSIMEKYN